MIGAALLQAALLAAPLEYVEALRSAISRHPLTQAARSRSVAASARAGQASSLYWPQIFAQGQYIRATQNGSSSEYLGFPDLVRLPSNTPKGLAEEQMLNNYIVAATVHQLLYDFGKTGGAVGAQQALHQASRMQERVVEQSVAFGAAQAFFASLTSRALVRAAEESEKRTAQTLEYARAGHRAGLRPPHEVARAEADSAAAQLGLVRAQAALELSLVQLGRAVGATSEPVEPIAAPPLPESVPTEEQALAAAMQARPELLALQAQRRAIDEQIRSAGAGHLPSIEATGSLNTRGQFYTPRGQTAFDVFNWDVGVLVRVPVFQGFLVQERVREANAELAALLRVQEDARQGVLLEVKQALLGVRSAREAQAAARKGLEAARTSLQMSLTRYQTGLANIVEASDAEAAYEAAQAAAARAEYDAHTAQAFLQRALGTLGSES
jgi:outer membrane protein